MIVYFYSLNCPKTNKIRYIGRTINPLLKRLRQHICESKTSPKKNYKTNWINSLLKENLKPNIELLFSYKDTSAIKINNKIILKNSGIIEKQLILSYINAGENLTNISLVEQSYYTYSFGENFKKKVSISQTKKVGRPITVLDLNNKLLGHFDSIVAASKFTKQKPERVRDIALNKRAAKKFIYLFTNEYVTEKDYSFKKYKQKISYNIKRIQASIKANTKPVYQILPNNTTIKYSSAKEASLKLNINYKYICELACKTRTSRNFKFTYTEPSV